MRYTNRHNLPTSLKEAIKKETYDLPKLTRTTISVSGLNMPPRIRQLQLRHWNEIETDYSDNIWMLLGSAVHEVLGRINKKGRIIEERFTEPIVGFKISGKPDLYDKEEKTVEDYKITSVWAVKGEKPEWEQQLNCYAWFLRRLKYEVRALYINAILRDWNRSGLKYDPLYPPIPFKRVEVPLWSFGRQDQYIKERLQLHISESKKPDNKLVLCTPKERWATTQKYAVIKGKNKRATRVFETKKDAEDFRHHLFGNGDRSRIEDRPGLDLRCKSYCSVANFCEYYKKTYGGKK